MDFVQRSDVEAISSEYVQDHAREVDVNGSLVQAVPKAGWWRRTRCYMVEHHFHVMRALFGMHFDVVVTSAEAQKMILYGPMDEALYVRLAAVAASVFARMACYERGPNGRARRRLANGELLPPPSMSDFARNNLCVPRYVVAPQKCEIQARRARC